MLLVAPNRSLGLEGPIDPLYGIDLWWKSIEFHGAEWRVTHSNIGGGLRGLSVLSAYAVNAAVALSTVDSDRSVGLGEPIRIL